MSDPDSRIRAKVNNFHGSGEEVAAYTEALRAVLDACTRADSDRDGFAFDMQAPNLTTDEIRELIARALEVSDD